MLLVVILATIVTLVGINRYQNHQWRKQLLTTNDSILQLLAAANHYYYRHCKDAGFGPTDITLTELVEEGDLPKREFIHNPWANPDHDPFWLRVTKIDGGDSPVYQLQVIGDFSRLPTGASLDFYQQQLGATDYDAGAQTLTWTTLPGYVNDAVDSSLWVLNNHLKTVRQRWDKDACPI